MFKVLSFVLLAGAALGFETNLAYRSPSLSIRALEINVEAVKGRLGKRQNSYYTGNVKFSFGVASGDPHQDSVILWTHVNALKSDPSGYPFCVHYRVSKSTDFSNSSLAADGVALTTWDVYDTVKVEATGLEPWTD